MSKRLVTVVVGLFAVTLAIAWSNFAQEPQQDKPNLPDLPGGSVLDQLGVGTASNGNEIALSGEYKIAKGKREGILSVRAEMEPGWHTYSITQRPGAPALPSSIKIASSKQYEFTRPFVPDRAPLLKREEGFDVPMEMYDGNVVWTAPFRVADGVDAQKLTFDVKYDGQVCETTCIPVKNRPVNISFAGEFAPLQVGEFQPKGTHAIIHGEVTPRTVAPGGVVKVSFTAKPEPGYHVYPYAERDPSKGSKPTLIAWKNDAGWKRSPAHASEKPASHETGLVDEPIQLIHDSPITWTVELQTPEDAAPGGYELRGLLGVQTCNNGGCDLPSGAEFSVVVEVAKLKADPAPEPMAFVNASYGSAAKLAAAATATENKRSATDAPAEASSTAASTQTKDGSPSPAGVAPAAPNSNQPIDLVNLNPIGGIDSQRSILVVLPMAFLAGFILNFMPCVLPVIGLKIFSFVNQAGASRARVLMLNVWYCAGIMFVFMVLATLAVFAGFSWGQQFQSATFNIVLASVVFAFALSFLGVWEIPLPGFVGSSGANKYAEQEGPTGAFFKGGLSTVLATPCSGPLLVPALAWAVQQIPAVTYAAFCFVGLGMASPYLLVGAFPRLVAFLPKPGAWMETFKQIMGFVLLGTVVFLLTYARATYVVPTVAFMMGLWAALWWIGRVPVWDDLGKRLRAWAAGIAFATLVGLISFTPFVAKVATALGAKSPWFVSIHELMETRFESQVDSAIATRMSRSATEPAVAKAKIGTELEWQPYSHELLAKHLADKRTVFIDFTADWCFNCKLNERVALNVAETKEFVEKNGISTLKADWTYGEPEVTEMLKRLGAGAIPVYAIFPSSTPERPIVISGLVTKNQIIDSLQKALSPDGTTTTSSKPLANEMTKR